jgi:formylglycine-generating enzyme required for sulfatase activity
LIDVFAAVIGPRWMELMKSAARPLSGVLAGALALVLAGWVGLYKSDVPHGVLWPPGVDRGSQRQQSGTDLTVKGDVESAEIVGEGALARVGETFRDCSDVCPEMVVVPAGEFMMGTDEYSDEWPVHKVTIRSSFAVAKFETTFAEWDACVAGGGCASNRSPSDSGWGRGRRPVINVSWNDAKEYVLWLSEKTGKTYRLLSSAEWEYAARGATGASTRYWWGDEISREYANYGTESYCNAIGVLGREEGTTPVGQFPANPLGLHDMHGNVWEWCEDDWHENYLGAPQDGSAWRAGSTSLRILRGGSWSCAPDFLRTRDLYGYSRRKSYSTIGFRVARTL